MDMQKQLDSWVEEGVPYLIQDDVTCAHQYFEIHCSRNRLEPEKRLMLAVLQNALFCFQRYFCARDGRHRKSFWEAWQWFNEEGSDSIFAFENICEVLGLDASYVRRGLKFARDCPGHSVDINPLISAKDEPQTQFEDVVNISSDETIIARKASISHTQFGN